MNSNPTNEADFLKQAAPDISDLRGGDIALEGPDRRDGRFYRYSPELLLAIRVAMSIGRPLLLFGPSGCGKSSLAPNLARRLGRRFYEFVVNSRSEAKDLFYRFDAIRRLGEAQLGSAGSGEWRSARAFVEPGPLWWVYNPQSAAKRGADESTGSPPLARDPGIWPEEARTDTPAAVLLLDEIDKADPDFPNNLLVPLGSRQFLVEETGDLVELGAGEAPLVIITSNRERELPAAFVRRCVALTIKELEIGELVELAQRTIRDNSDSYRETLVGIAETLRDMHRGLKPVSPAEYLDTVKAIRVLNAEKSQWEDIIMKTSWTAHDSRLESSGRGIMT